MKAARVVIVDDDHTIRILARMALTAAGFDVHEAATGEHGRRLAVEVGAHCVLVDLGLSDMDGLDLISALRSRNEFDCTAIIVLTGLADRETKACTFAAGADDYIVKPFMPQDLVARVQGVLHADHSGANDTAAPRHPASHEDSRPQREHPPQPGQRQQPQDAWRTVGENEHRAPAHGGAVRLD